MSEDERNIGRKDPSAEKPKPAQVRFLVFSGNKPPLPENIANFIYDENEILRLGNGDLVEGLTRLAKEVMLGGRTIEEITSSPDKPLQDELDLLMPPSPAPKLN